MEKDTKKFGIRMAREVLLQNVYSLVVNSEAEPNLVLNLERNGVVISTKENLKKKDIEFIETIFNGIKKDMPNLTESVKGAVKDFSYNQILDVDLACMFIAIYEVKNNITPKEVAINEALELVKTYSLSTSGSFVNGILKDVLA